MSCEYLHLIKSKTGPMIFSFKFVLLLVFSTSEIHPVVLK